MKVELLGTTGKIHWKEVALVLGVSVLVGVALVILDTKLTGKVSSLAASVIPSRSPAPVPKAA